MYHRHCLYYAVSCSRVGIVSDLHSIILLGFQLLNDMLYHRSSGCDGKKKKKRFCPISFGIKESHGLGKNVWNTSLEKSGIS